MSMTLTHAVVADGDNLLGDLHVTLGQLGDVHQALDALADPHERAERNELGDLARDDLPDLVQTGEGLVQCYEFTRSTKVWVADYDPNSDVMVDFEGAPQLAIIICWDYNRSSGEWDSRIFFYGTPVSASA